MMTMPAEEAKAKNFAVIQPWVALVMSVGSAILAGGSAWGVTQYRVDALEKKVQTVETATVGLKSEILGELRLMREEADEDRDMIVKALNALDNRLSREEVRSELGR